MIKSPNARRAAVCLAVALSSACTPEIRENAAQFVGRAPGTRPASFTLVATGDFLLHQPLIDQAAGDAARRGRSGWDFRPMLDQLKPLVRGADLGVCHVETPVARRGGPFRGYPSFSSPPQIVDAVRALGYDTCSTASNHTIDQGEDGVRRTLAALDAAGIAHAGSARSAAEARRVTMLDVRGVKVAHLSYTYGTNGIPEPGRKPWLVNDTLRADVILAEAARARRRGAEVVVTSLHWGDEYRHRANAQQRALAKRLLASPHVDLILGDHAHVVQPFDRINGKWVVYGMGNQVATPHFNAEATHEGLVARFRFARRDGRWRGEPTFVPTLVTAGPPIRLLDLRRALADRDREDHRRAYDRTVRVVRSLGEDVQVAPLTRPRSERRMAQAGDWSDRP